MVPCPRRVGTSREDLADRWQAQPRAMKARCDLARTGNGGDLGERVGRVVPEIWLGANGTPPLTESFSEGRADLFQCSAIFGRDPAGFLRTALRESESGR